MMDESTLDRPIVVLGMGKSGASLVSDVILDHCTNSYFDSEPLERYLKNKIGKGLGRTYDYDPNWRPYVETELNAQGYKGNAFVLRSSGILWRVWGDFDPIWVKVRRPKCDIFTSIRRARMCRWMSDQALRDAIDLCHDEMDCVEGPSVYTPDVLAGDDSTIRLAVEHCGFEYDPEITAEYIS